MAKKSVFLPGTAAIVDAGDRAQKEWENAMAISNMIKVKKGGLPDSL